ncbi:unnamed protein product, partial [Discosporangium mesarthrocarpum]
MEHDLFLSLAGVRDEEGEKDAWGEGGAVEKVEADLSKGLGHALAAEEALRRAGMSDPGTAAPGLRGAAGVCACMRGLLLRDLSEIEAPDPDPNPQSSPRQTTPGGNEGGPSQAMDDGLALLDGAIRGSGWRPTCGGGGWGGGEGREDVLGCLEVLEAHYAMLGDTLRRVRAGKLRALVLGAQLAGARAGRDGASRSLQDMAALASALGVIGEAYHFASSPGLSISYRDAAQRELSDCPDPPLGAMGALDGESAAARVLASVLQGLCLVEEPGGATQAEAILLEARQSARELKRMPGGGWGDHHWGGGGGGAGGGVVAARLECVAGMGLSGLYEREGRLVEAMGELRGVLHLCQMWASAGAPPDPDRRVVSLPPQGRSIYDSGLRLGLGSGGGEEEEGVGGESSELEESMGLPKVGPGQGHGRGQKPGPALGRVQGQARLGLRWLPLYLEGLACMGRLWRVRGFAHKARGYLRQGSAISERVQSARLLRVSLMAEVELAAQMGDFERTERLLRVCEGLLGAWTGGELGAAAALGPGSEGDSSGATDGRGEDGGDGTHKCPVCGSPAPVNPSRGQSKEPNAHEGRGRGRGRGTAREAPLEDLCCIRCWERSLDEAEILVVEADLFQRQGKLQDSLSACLRGRETLSYLQKVAEAHPDPPLVSAQDDLCPWGNSMRKEEGGCNGRRNNRRSAQRPGAGAGVGRRARALLAGLWWRQGRVLSLLGDDPAAEACYEGVTGLEGAPALDKAAAHYHLGMLRSGSGDGAGAWKCLEAAERLVLGSGAPELVRNVRRALAAVLIGLGMGGAPGVGGSWRVASLASLSIGVTHCNQVVHKVSR